MSVGVAVFRLPARLLLPLRVGDDINPAPPLVTSVRPPPPRLS